MLQEWKLLAKDIPLIIVGCIGAKPVGKSTPASDVSIPSVIVAVVVAGI